MPASGLYMRTSATSKVAWPKDLVGKLNTAKSKMMRTMFTFRSLWFGRYCSHHIHYGRNVSSKCSLNAPARREFPPIIRRFVNFRWVFGLLGLSWTQPPASATDETTPYRSSPFCPAACCEVLSVALPFTFGVVEKQAQSDARSDKLY